MLLDFNVQLVFNDLSIPNDNAFCLMLKWDGEVNKQLKEMEDKLMNFYF